MSGCGLLPANGTADDLLRLFNDGGQMVRAFKALGVEFVDMFGAGRARREPAAN